MENAAEIVDNLSVDCVIFGFEDHQLKLLLVRHGDGVSKGEWALPGGFIEQFEDIDDAAERVLHATTGIKSVFLDQLRIFGNVNRYPFRRVLTMAYFALARPEKYQIIPGFTADDAKWFNVTEIPQLIFDHNHILECARDHLKNKLRYEPLGLNLLPEEFTLTQLQELYEVVLERTLDEQRFRAEILSTGMLKTVTASSAEQGQKKGVYVFDKEGYQKLLQQGSIFDFD